MSTCQLFYKIVLNSFETLKIPHIKQNIKVIHLKERHIHKINSKPKTCIPHTLCCVAGTIALMAGAKFTFDSFAGGNLYIDMAVFGVSVGVICFTWPIAHLIQSNINNIELEIAELNDRVIELSSTEPEQNEKRDTIIEL